MYMVRTPRTVVVGAGVGGLAAALRLAAAGVETTLVERAPTVGGKLRTLSVGDAQIPAGPTVLTMPWAFEELFEAAGASFRERVPLVPLDPIARHFFADGSVLDLSSDPARAADDIGRFAGASEAAGHRAFLAHGKRIFDTVFEPYFRRPLPKLGELFSLAGLKMASSVTRIDAARSMWRALQDFFRDPRLLALFGRYATYVGSSPFAAPGTLNLVAWVEQAFGVHRVVGGIEHLARAIHQRFTELGGLTLLDAEVTAIERVGGAVSTVVLADGRVLPADAVIWNGEATALERLVEGDRTPSALPSLSAFLHLVVAKRLDAPLLHHTVVFPVDYRAEHDDLFTHARPPRDPTVYLCAPDRLGEIDGARIAPGLAGEVTAERLFMLTNAPGARPIDGPEEIRCRQRIRTTLARANLTIESIRAERVVTPQDFAARFPGSRGSIYGAAQSSPFSALSRPSNAHPRCSGLFRVGGSVHPGAGLPMVTLSAAIACDAALRHLSRSTSTSTSPTSRRTTDTLGGTSTA